MTKPTVIIKQRQYCTVLNIKGRIGFVIICNNDIKTKGMAASLRDHADNAKSINCNHHARFCNDLAFLLSKGE